MASHAISSWPFHSPLVLSVILIHFNRVVCVLERVLERDVWKRWLTRLSWLRRRRRRGNGCEGDNCFPTSQSGPPRTSYWLDVAGLMCPERVLRCYLLCRASNKYSAFCSSLQCEGFQVTRLAFYGPRGFHDASILVMRLLICELWCICLNLFFMFCRYQVQILASDRVSCMICGFPQFHTWKFWGSSRKICR
jgi:hypothetical protein